MNKKNKLEELRQQRNQYINKHQWQKALEIIDEMIQITPVASFYTRKGMILVKIKNYHEGIESLKKALSINPQEKRAKDILSRICQQTEKTLVDLSSSKIDEYIMDIDPDEKTTIYQQESTIAHQEESKLPGLSFGVSQMFSHYRILKKLGQGGMGVVYQALDTRLQRVVALKLIIMGEASSNLVQRFLQEIRTMAQLEHPNIVKLLEVGESPQHYFTMEYIAGKDLAFLTRAGNISPHQAASYTENIARALDAAHQKNIIHRDIKPANVMVDDKNQPKVMDFGLAKIKDSESNLSKTGDMLGTPAYMPPEQAHNKDVDFRVDIYSLGATLYYLLTSRPPFQGESNWNILFQIMEKEPIEPRKLNPDIPADLEAICLKCLEKSPEKRYSSAKLLANDLQNFLENKPIIAKPPTPLVHFKKFLARHRNVAITSFTVIFSIIAAAIFSFFMWQRESAQRSISDQLRQTKSKEAYIAKVKLAKIALKKAEEAYDNQKWGETGILAGTSLDILKEFATGEVLKLKTKGENFVKLATARYGLLWETPGYTIVTDMTYSLDGKKLFTLTFPKHLDLWDTTSGRNLYRLSTKGHPTHLFFTSKLLARATSTGAVAIWSPNKNKILSTITPKKGQIVSLAGHAQNLAVIYRSGHLFFIKNKGKILTKEVKLSKNAVKVLFSNDGKFIYIAFTNSIEMRDLNGAFLKKVIASKEIIQDIAFSSRGKLLVALKKQVNIYEANGSLSGSLVHKNEVKSISSHPFKAKIATISEKQTAQFWDLDTLKPTFTLPQKTVLVKFHPQKPLLAILDPSYRCLIWDIIQKKYLYDPKNSHKSANYAVDFNSNSKYLASACHDKNVRIWDHKGKLIRAIKYNQVVYSLDFHPHKASWLVIGGADKKIELRNIHQHKVIKTWPTKDIVQSVAFSPDGKKILSVSKKNAKLWDIALDKPIQTYPLVNGRSAIFHPDGKSFASISNSDFNVRIWDVKSKQVTKIKEFEFISAIAFHPNRKFLAIAVYKNDGKNLFLWDIKRKSKVTLPGEPKSILDLAFSKDGKFLISVSYEGSIKFWDFKQKKLIKTMVDFSRYVARVTVAPDNKKFAVSCGDYALRVWQYPFLTPLKTLTTNSKNKQLPMAFNAAGNSFVFAHQDHKVKIWDIPNNQPKSELVGHQEQILQIKISPNDKFIATTSLDETTKLWTSSGKQLYTQPQLATSMAFSPDSKAIAFAYYNRSSWLKNFNNSLVKRFSLFFKKAVFSPDGKFLVTANKKIYLWNVKTKKLVATLGNYKKKITMIKFISSDTFLVTIEHNVYLWNTLGKQINSFKIWFTHKGAISPDGKVWAQGYFRQIVFSDTTTGQTLNSIAAPINPRNKVVIQFSPGGKQLLFSHKNILYIQDIATKKIVKKLIGHAKDITKITFSSDGKTAASASKDIIKLWDFERGTAIKSIKAHNKEVTHLLFSKNTLVSAAKDHTVKIWQLATGNLIQKISFNSYPIAIDPKAGLIYSSVQKPLIKIYNLGNSLQQIASFKGHSKKITSLIFIPLKNQLISTSLDSTIKIWDITTNKLIKTLFDPDKSEIKSALFVAQGKKLVTNTSDLKLWFLDQGTVRGSNRKYHYLPVTKMTLNTFGTFLASSSQEEIRVWDALKAQLKSSLAVPGTMHLSFVPNRNILAATDNNGLFKCWDIHSEKQLLEQKNIFSFVFSPNGKLAALITKEKNILLLYTKDLFPPKNLFSFRKDFSKGFLQQELQKNPLKITQKLFRRKTNSVFSISPFMHQQLWSKN